MKQPEALRLTETLEEEALMSALSRREHLDYRADAATELRRQHAELERKDKLIAELVEALTVAVTQNDYDMLMTGEELRMCAAVLSKAKEQ